MKISTGCNENITAMDGWGKPSVTQLKFVTYILKTPFYFCLIQDSFNSQMNDTDIESGSGYTEAVRVKMEGKECSTGCNENMNIMDEGIQEWVKITQYEERHEQSTFKWRDIEEQQVD